METQVIYASLVPLAFFLFGFGAALALLSGNKLNESVLSACLSGACLLLLLGALTHWPSGFAIGPLPIYLGGLVPLVQRADALSLFFLAVLSFAAMSVALYSPSYLSHLKGSYNRQIFWVALFLFVASMAQVFLSADAITFTVFWELMSLSSVALVLTDHVSRKAKEAALIYLGATRVSTTCIFTGFLWLHFLSDSWNFVDWRGLGEPSFVPLAIVFIGLCIKAGTWPFHLWLPYAHTQAPAPISALMSGVMVKVAVYAMIRLFLTTDASSPLIAYLAIALGSVSAFWGILFAQLENDLKRLLAYSTVENIGLIVLAIGLVLLAKCSGTVEPAAIAFTACLFHVLNHGMYKPLLFCAAGSVDCSVHTREISRLGGLQRYMPFTAAAFFFGSAAICALPPLNGFASKWMLYQGLFSTACSSSSIANCAIGIFIIGLLSMVGAMSVAAFTKGFGLSFLGRPRTSAVERAHEVPIVAVLSQALLMAACLFFSIFAAYVPKWLAPAASGIVPALETRVFLPEPQLLMAMAVLLPVFFALLVDFGRRNVKYFSTWECGYGFLPKRSLMDALSFSRSLTSIFKLVLQFRTIHIISGRDRRHFPDSIQVEKHQTFLVEKWIYAPILRALDAMGLALVRLQTGSIHVHLLYVFATLILLVFIGTQ